MRTEADTGAAERTPGSTARRQTAKRWVKTGAYAAAAAGGSARRLRSPQPDPALTVLMHHKVNDLPGNSVTVTRTQFRQQIAIAVRDYAVVTPEAVLCAVNDGTPLPPRALLLTFDDGYRDNFENAYPVLKEFGLRALLFPATGFIGTKRVLPHDQGILAANPMLTWSELGAMGDVFTIGSHGVSHRVLTRMSMTDARNEIRASKAEIQDRLGTAVDFFSYPKGSRGDYSPALEDEVAKAGYSCSFSTVPGGNTLDHMRSGSLLRRYNAEPLPTPLFRSLLNGSCDAIAWKDTGYGSIVKGQLNRLLRTQTR